jgi:hypothetical protein
MQGSDERGKERLQRRIGARNEEIPARSEPKRWLQVGCNATSHKEVLVAVRVDQARLPVAGANEND